MSTIRETDDEVYAPVRDSFAGVDLETSLDGVIGRGRRLRRRRRTLAGAATMGVAAVAAAALAVPSATAPAGSGLVAGTGTGTTVAGAAPHSGPARLGSTRPGSTWPAVHIQLAGWSMQSTANGTVTLTFHDFTDLPQLRQALAQAGIQAVVQGSFPTCGPGAPGVHQLPTGAAVTVSIDQNTYTVTEVINAAAMPAGSVLRLVGVQLNNPRLEVRKSHGQDEQLPVIGVQTALYNGQPAADQCDQDSTIQAFFGPTPIS